MKLVHKNHSFAIYDDFLDLKDLYYIRTFIQEEEFKFAQYQSWNKINRITDGNHLQGQTYLSPNAPKFNNCVDFPTKKAIDILHDIILEKNNVFEEIIGKKGTDWYFYTLKPFMYPKNTGVSWHDDYTKCSGTFTLYCHQEWNIQWGGELLIAHTSQKNAPPLFRKKYLHSEKQPIWPYLDNSKQNKIVMKPGYGTYILPKPNRIVLTKAGTTHMVKKVDSSAGDKMRWSIQGFFQNLMKKEARF